MAEPNKKSEDEEFTDIVHVGRPQGKVQGGKMYTVDLER